MVTMALGMSEEKLEKSTYAKKAVEDFCKETSENLNIICDLFKKNNSAKITFDDTDDMEKCPPFCHRMRVKVVKANL